MSPDELIVRTAGGEDVATIVSFNQALFQEDAGQRDPTINLNWPAEHGPSYFAAMLAKDSCLGLIADLAGKPVGYLFGTIKDQSRMRLGRHAELESMYVLDEYRRQGVGTALALRFLSWCKDAGAEKVSVWAYTRNEQAVTFYKGLGFAPRSITLVIDPQCIDLDYTI